MESSQSSRELVDAAAPGRKNGVIMGRDVDLEQSKARGLGVKIFPVCFTNLF